MQCYRQALVFVLAAVGCSLLSSRASSNVLLLCCTPYACCIVIQHLHVRTAVVRALSGVVPDVVRKQLIMLAGSHTVLDGQALPLDESDA